MYDNYLNRKFTRPEEPARDSQAGVVSSSNQVEWTKEWLADQCRNYGRLEITAENGGPIYAIFQAMRRELLAKAKAIGIETPLADSLEGQVKGFLHKLLSKLETPEQRQEVLAAINKTLKSQEHFPITNQQLENVETLTPWLVSAIQSWYKNFSEDSRFNAFLVDVKHSGTLSANNPLKKERGSYVLPRLYVSTHTTGGGFQPWIRSNNDNPTSYRYDILLGKQFIKYLSIRRVINTLAHEMRHLRQFYLGVNLEVIPEFEGKDLDFTGRPEDFVNAYVATEKNNPERYKLICQAMEVDAEMYKAKIMGGMYGYLEDGYYTRAIAGTDQNKIAQPTRKQMMQGAERLIETMQPITLVEKPTKIDGTSQCRVWRSDIYNPSKLECMGYRPATQFPSHAERAAARSTTTANPTRGA